MTTEPQRKAHILVHESNPEHGTILFTAPDYAARFEKFGRLESSGYPGVFRIKLYVDPRYDFSEVVDYITNYQP